MILHEGDSRLEVKLVSAAPIYVPPAQSLRVRTRHGRVFVLYGPDALSMSTPISAKVGFALAKSGAAAAAAGDWVAFKIDRTELVLLPEAAIQLGGVMLKKTDRADDFQRIRRPA